MMTASWQNKWAIITGASSGIGYEFAKTLGRLGVNLILVARREELLSQLKEEIQRDCSVQVEYLSLDLTADGATEKVLPFALSKTDKIHFLINNAGKGLYGPFTHFPLEEEHKLLQLNIVVLVHLTHHFIQHALSHKEQSYVVQLGSILGFCPTPYMSVYSSTKSFVKSFNQTLAIELKSTNIHMMNLSPGGTLTEFSSQSGLQLSPLARRGMMRSQDVVDYGIKGMQRKKQVVIPGFMNQFFIFFLGLLPERLATVLFFAVYKNLVSMK